MPTWISKSSTELEIVGNPDGISDAIYWIIDEEDSGNSCIISKNRTEPIIKSRVIDFIVGFLFSTLYVLKAPNADINEPPIKIPYTLSIVSGFENEKT